MVRPAKHIEAQLIADNPDMKARGLRPDIVWVKEKDETFDAAWKRQIEAINNSPEEVEILNWVEQVVDWPKD